jgi:hypothetical protein
MRAIGYCALIVCIAAVIIIAAVAPFPLSDKNDFLKGFVNHELLATLGVILAITIASAGQLHLTLNDQEIKYKQPGAFKNTRDGVKKAAYWMIALFFFAVVDVIVKPLVPKTQTWEALTNGAAVVIVLATILILVSIIRLVFAIKPDG